MIRLKFDVMGGEEVLFFILLYVYCSINKIENFFVYYCIKMMMYEYSDLFEFERNFWFVYLCIVIVLVYFVRW